jgi:hypothetical protein
MPGPISIQPRDWPPQAKTSGNARFSLTIPTNHGEVSECLLKLGLLACDEIQRDNVKVIVFEIDILFLEAIRQSLPFNLRAQTEKVWTRLAGYSGVSSATAI